jgi:general secretion pathway protein C
MCILWVSPEPLTCLSQKGCYAYFDGYDRTVVSHSGRIMLATLRRLFRGGIQPDTLARFTLPVNVLLVILLAHSLAQLSWGLLPITSLTPSGIQESREESLSSPIAAGKLADYTAIASWHLFGQASETKPAIASGPVQAPETKLDLKLVGILYSSDSHRTLALISEGNGEELSYFIGQQLPQSKVLLEQILRDRVVLSRNGKLETLSLPLETEGIESNPGVDLQSQPPAADSETPVEGEPAVEGEPPHNPEGTTGALVNPEPIDASAIASRFREKLPTQPQYLQDLALATPYVQNGRFMGFRLRPGRDRTLLAQLGLRAGDVITAVNGTRLDDPGKGAGLLQEIANASQVDVQVLRNGAEIPYTFILNAE